MPNDLVDRLVKALLAKVAVPVVDWLTPSLAKALGETIVKTSDEAKVGLAYGLVHKKLGEMLSLGPQGASPVLDALVGIGVPRDAAIEVIGNFLAAFDKALMASPPN